MSWPRRSTPATVFRDNRYGGTAENWRRRPRQLSAVLDRLLGDAEFGPRIDDERIGAVGHSAGGYSVLALIGGAGGHERTRAPLHAASRTRPRLLRLRPGRTATQAGPMPNLSDPRVGAVVAVAPVGAVFGEGAFAGVRIPAQVHRLEADRILREPWHAENIAALMGEKTRTSWSTPTRTTSPSSRRSRPPWRTKLAPRGAIRRASTGSAFLAQIDEQTLEFFDDALPVP